MSRGGRGAAWVAAGILASRVLGLVKERVFGHYFGAGDFADVWRAGFRIPNVMQNLLGEGTLSASLIPVYAAMLEEGEVEKAARFAGAALGLLIVVAATVALVGIVVAPGLVAVFFFRWDPAKQDATVAVMRVLFPMMGVLVISAWALGILNSHRRFFVSYVAPVFANVAMIGGMVAGALYFGFGPDSRDLVMALAWGALVGGVLQVGAQAPFLWGHVRGMRLSLGRGVEGVSEAVRSFWPVVAARGVVNLSGWLDMWLAGLLVGGAIATIGYAQAIYMLPISLFGMSIAASELPELSRMRGDAARVVAERVALALRRVQFFLIPSALACILMGDVIVGALFQTGEFGEAGTLVTWAILAAYALGLPASASSRVLSSAFYALRDTRTPARIAYLRVVVSALVGVGLMFPLDRLGFASLRLGAGGLALGATAGAWLEYALLRRSLRSRVGPHGPGASRTARLALAGAFGTGAAVLLQLTLPAVHPVLLALETLTPFGVVYLAAAAYFGEGVPWRRLLSR